MQYPIGQHALLANRKTAALINPEGDVVWMCWPRVDSMPMLFSILDEVRGGAFTVRPCGEATLLNQAYLPDSLVLATTWNVAGARLVVEDSLSFESSKTPQRLLRGVRASGAAVEVEVTFAPAVDAGQTTMELVGLGSILILRGGGLDITAHSPGNWIVRSGVATTSFLVDPGEVVYLSMADTAANALSDAALHEQTLADWQQQIENVSVIPSDLALQVLGEEKAQSLTRKAAAVLVGLQQPNGSIVAAPTTSLPQWPGSGRTWDYRYAWLRDTALAGLAMIRLGLVDNAKLLGEFLGQAAADIPPRALRCVDGSQPPPETTLDELTGFGGARPVRIGNAAADQPQLDTAGEVLEFASALAAVADLPPSLAQSCCKLADWAADKWRDPDFGIWEIRGVAHHYTHSRVMAWVALYHAIALADSGLLRGNADHWRATLDEIHKTVLDCVTDGSLQLHESGGGPDAALALVPLVGFLEVDNALTQKTLDEIVQRLDRSGLIDRYLGQPDELGDPCAPFLFPTFWLASALQHCNRDGSRYFAAAVSARGIHDLFGEVANPDDGTPLGNYPQIQSHAAFVMAAAQPRA